MSSSPATQALRLDRPLRTSMNQVVEARRLASRNYYGFLPGETICVMDRNIGFPYLYRGCLQLITNHPYMKDNYAESCLNSPTATEDEQIPDEKYASVIAAELYGAYAGGEKERGFRIIEALTGRSPEEVAQVQVTIFPEVPATLKAMERELNGAARERIKQRSPNAQTVMNAAADQMLLAVSIAILAYDHHCQSRVKEMKDAMKPNGRGISFVDEFTKNAYEQLEKAQPDDILADLARAQQNQKFELVMPEKAAIPQVQCGECGEFTNLLADGSSPRKGCKACGAAFVVEAVAGVSPSVPTPIEAFPPEFTTYLPNSEGELRPKVEVAEGVLAGKSSAAFPDHQPTRHKTLEEKQAALRAKNQK